MSRDLNKICVTFPSSILDMIIVCFLYFDNSLFAGLYNFWPFYSYIPNVKTFLFSNVRMKNPNFKSEKISKKKTSFCRVNCD